jgi:phage tail-like protein
MSTYNQKWNFQVELDGVVVAKVRTVSEISFDTEDVEVPEGGNPILHKEPGGVTVPDVTLARGVFVDDVLYNHAMQTVAIIEGGGLVPDELKKDYDIVWLLRDGTESRRVTLVNAYGKSYNFGDGDASARGDISLEQLVLRYDFPRRATL